MLEEIIALIDNETYAVSNMANTVAYLNTQIDRINWIGFYIVRNNILYVGPFIGLPACVKIEIGKGVCGTCALTKTVRRVADVHKFDGHIACDCRSNSEIVLPLIKNNEVVAVLDIDSEEFDRFDENIENELIKVCDYIANISDW